MRFFWAALFAIIVTLGLNAFQLTNVAVSIESGLLSFTAIILIFYTKETQEMKHQIINQTRAILTPSLVVTFASFGDRHNQANFRVENFSRENIALNFQGEIFFKDSKIDEKRIAVISYGGAGTKGFYPDSIVFPFNVSEEHYDNRDKLRFEYSYYDRTGKFKFKGLIKSLHRDGLRGNFQRHLKRKKIYMA